jgi:hypothetical protein
LQHKKKDEAKEIQKRTNQNFFRGIVGGLMRKENNKFNLITGTVLDDALFVKAKKKHKKKRKATLKKIGKNQTYSHKFSNRMPSQVSGDNTNTNFATRRQRNVLKTH